MKNIFDGYLLLSDLDGTLLNEQKQIPQRNLQAIQHFTQEGGLFTLATGRSPIFVQELAKQLPINSPCVVLNGAQVYDLQQGCGIGPRFYLPKSCQGLLEKIVNDLPQAGLLIMTDARNYVISTSNEPALRRNYYGELVGLRSATFSEIDGEWNKAIFIHNPEEMEALDTYFSQLDMPDISHTRSCNVYMELQPRQATKGAAMLRLAKYLGILPEHTIAIGDYLNDLSMLQAAGIPVVPSRCHPDLLEKVHPLQVGSCEQGAVADAIEWLENHLSAHLF